MKALKSNAVKNTLSISVCIPTYKRPDLLTEALASCLAQTHLPQEILIGDNSPDNATQELVQGVMSNTSVTIRYFHNIPSLTQVSNVDDLFSKAEGDVLLLLHDDDTIVPDCLENLLNCFIANPEVDVVVGKQYIMSNEGQIDYKLSEQTNKQYYRTSPYSGTKLSPLEAVILQQLPPDCYMIRTAVAKKLRYNGESNHACDFEFALKLGLENHKIYFLDKHTSCYRLSANALSKNINNNGGLVIYHLVEALNVPQESLKYQAQVLKTMAPVAVIQAANLKLPVTASKIFFGKWHRGKILTKTGARGVYHLVRALVRTKF